MLVNRENIPRRNICEVVEEYEFGEAVDGDKRVQKSEEISETVPLA